MAMQSMKFVGWVEKICDADQYNRDFVVRDYKDDNDPEKPKYPTALTFRAAVKSGASLQLDDVNEGDKVAVTFFLTGKSGISKAGKYYHINALNIAKDKGVVVLERAAVAETPAEEQGADEPAEDLPF